MPRKLNLSLSRQLAISISMLLATGFASSTAQVSANNANSEQPPCLILLHGLARTSKSMNKAANYLGKNGFHTINIDYPSRKANIAELSSLAINTALSRCENHQQRGVFVLTHSLGGILLRYYLNENTIQGLRRVVMLAPPNQGSEVVDVFGRIPGFNLINGLAGQQLGTGANSVPRQLGAVNFELGVIAGTRSINLILSQVLPNPDDGKVSVEAARVDGMCAFLTHPVSHPLIMKNNDVLEQALHFFEHGQFDADEAEDFTCN